MPTKIDAVGSAHTTMDGHILGAAVAATAAAAAVSREELCELLSAMSTVAIEDVKRLCAVPVPAAASAVARGASASVAVAGLACVAARSLAQRARRSAAAVPAAAAPAAPGRLVERVAGFVAGAELAMNAAARCRPGSGAAGAMAAAAAFANAASSAHAAVLIAYYDVVIATEGPLDTPHGRAALSPKKRQKTKEGDLRPHMERRDLLVWAVRATALTLSSFAVPAQKPRPSDAETEEKFAAARLRFAAARLRHSGGRGTAGPQTVFEHHIGLLDLSVAIRMWCATPGEKWNFVCAEERARWW